MLNYREYQKANKEAFHHAHQLFMILCARDAIKFVPLREFSDALFYLEVFLDDPSVENRKRLQKIYRDLKAGEDSILLTNHRGSGVYNFYRGIRSTLWIALQPTKTASDWDASSFSECIYHTAQNLAPFVPKDEMQNWEWAEDIVQKEVRKRFHGYFTSAFSRLDTEFHTNWKGYKAATKEQVTTAVDDAIIENIDSDYPDHKFLPRGSRVTFEIGEYGGRRKAIKIQPFEAV